MVKFYNSKSEVGNIKLDKELIIQFDIFTCKISNKTTYVFIRLETKNKIVGWGEATLKNSEKEVIEELFKIRSGNVPRTISDYTNQFRSPSKWKYGRTFIVCQSAIEQAVYEIRAISLGVPVYELLGGSIRQEIPYYANINKGTLDRTTKGWIKRSKKAIESGFNAIKFAPFDDVKFDGKIKNKKSVQDEVKKIISIREFVGDDIDLIIDCHWCFNEFETYEFIKNISSINPFWIEGPILENLKNIKSLKKIRNFANEHNILLSGGEFLQGIHSFLPFLENQVFDVINPDVRFCGILEMLHIGAISNAYKIKLSPHNPNGPIIDAASAHICVASQSIFNFEMQFEESDLANKLFSNHQVNFQNGFKKISDGIGWGINLDESLLTHI